MGNGGVGAMRVVITRPGEDGAALAEILGARGIETVLEPLLTIKQLDGPSIDLSGIQAILVTSANGVRALARRTDNRSIPVFAVGDATATTSRSSGFQQVHSASGDVVALAGLVKDLLKPVDGPLLHIAGTEIAGDLAAMVGEAGFECRREVLYEAEKARTLSTSLTAAIKENQIDAVLLYSPRSADAFVQLLRKARIVRSCQSMKAICLSQAVAQKVEELHWREVLIASHPTQESLLELLDSETGADGQDAKSNLDDDRSTSQDHHDDKMPPQGSAAAHTIAPIQRRRGGTVRTVFLTLFVAVILFGAGAATKPLWRSHVAEYLPEGLLMSLSEKEMASKFEEVAGRLNSLENRSKGQPVPDLKTLQAERDRLHNQLAVTLERLDKLESSIDTVKNMIRAVNTETGAGAEEMLRRLSDRLNKLEQQSADLEKRTTQQGQSKASIRSKAFLLAVGQLRDAARSGRSFKDELMSVEEISKSDDLNKAQITSLLAKLAETSATGLPLLSKLQAEFRSLAGSIVRAEKSPEEGSWVQRTLSRLTQSVKWRRTDNIVGTGVEAVVARVEQAVNAGDLARAVKELSALKGQSAKIAVPWVKEAVAHLNAQESLSRLQSIAVSQLAANG